MKAIGNRVSRRVFLALSTVGMLLDAAKGQAAGFPRRAKSILNARRVVTGHDLSGKSIITQNGPAPRTVTSEALPGFAMVEVWATDRSQRIPVSQGDPTVNMPSFVPPVDGTRFRVVEFPPASKQKLDAEAFHRDFLKKAPGLAEAFDPPEYMMHTTESMDYGVVVSGEITLIVGNGANADLTTVDLKQGDCVVQNGTRHAWWNRSHRPCVMAFVLIGATRQRQ